MSFGSLFTGIGGLDLGLERAGMLCKWQVEIDPFCLGVLKKHWPEVPKYGDVRDLSGSQLQTVDVICGGFPCQPVSAAGGRQGLSDPRWLWPHFARLVDELGPSYVIVENVPGLLSQGGTQVVTDLAEMGFNAEWGVVSAAAMGASHRRDRVWLVAYPQCPRLEGLGRQRQLGEGSQEKQTGRSGDDERIVAHTDRSAHRRIHGGWQNEILEAFAADGGQDAANADRGRRHRRAWDFWAGRRPQPAHSGWWAAESGLGPVAHGVSGRMGMLKALGNSVVPQWAEMIGQLVIEMDRSPEERGNEWI